MAPVTAIIDEISSWLGAMDNALLHASGLSPADKIEEWVTFALCHARLYLAESDGMSRVVNHNYHEFCNMNDPSSMFISPPPITNIESLSQSAIASIDSGSFGISRADVNIQQPITLEVSDTETVMVIMKI